MTNGGKDWGQRLSRWLDEWKIAASGIVLATRSARFLAVFAVTFVLFGILMNLLSGSSAALSLAVHQHCPYKKSHSDSSHEGHIKKY